VVRPTLTFAAPIWHQPEGTTEATKRHTKKLTIIQNDCLRTILGAFKATPVPVLEADAVIAPIKLQLDRLVLRYQTSRGTHPVTQAGNRRIWNKLQGKGTRQRQTTLTPAIEKEAWALRALGVREWHEAAITTRRKKNWTNPVKDVEEYQNTKTIDERVRDWARQQWLDRWTSPARVITPAQEGDLFGNRFDYHSGLRKAESSMAVQLRCGKIGLNEFLYQMNVPTVRSASCLCGWRRQTAKHMLVFCPELARSRAKLVQQAGTSDFREMLGQIQGIRAAARWMVETGWLGQFSLAREQLARSRVPLEAKETPKPAKEKKKRRRLRGRELKDHNHQPD
jgi:hypothetical protein